MLNILALVHRDEGNMKEASRLLHDALNIRQKVLGPKDPAVAATLNNLATAYMKHGKYVKAEQLYKEILNRAHEDQFGSISDTNKTIWKLADRTFLESKNKSKLNEN